MQTINCLQQTSRPGSRLFVFAWPKTCTMATRRPTSVSLGESRIVNKTDHRHKSDVIIMINNNSYNKTLIIKLTQLRTEDITLWQKLHQYTFQQLKQNFKYCSLPWTHHLTNNNYTLYNVGCTKLLVFSTLLSWHCLFIAYHISDSKFALSSSPDNPSNVLLPKVINTNVFIVISFTPPISWRREKWKEEALDDLPWKDERGPSPIRRTLELFQKQRWENVWETGWSAYGLYRAHRYHLELNWIELN